MDYTSFLTPENASLLASILIGSLGSYFGWYRRKVSALRNFITKLDEANADNTITSEEFTGIIKAGKEILL